MASVAEGMAPSASEPCLATRTMLPIGVPGPSTEEQGCWQQLPWCPRPSTPGQPASVKSLCPLLWFLVGPSKQCLCQVRARSEAWSQQPLTRVEGAAGAGAGLSSQGRLRVGGECGHRE